jgi:DNA-binding MarR family transcriptional regulator
MTVHLELSETMRDLHLRMHRLLNQTLKGQGVSLAQLKLLHFIERGRSVRAIDISDAFGFAPRTVTEAVDALERDGLARRDPDPNDRRAKRISITDKGSDIIRDADPSRQAFASNVFGVLTKAEEAELIRLLQMLNTRLVELGAPNPYGDGEPSAAKSV